jgi:type II secretory pathway component PulK
MRSPEKGYALLLAVAIVSVLAFAALASARVLGDARTSIARLQQEDDAAVAAETMLNRVAFLLLTEANGAEQASARGLRMDGAWQAVHGAPRAFVAVQDEAGPFNLNATDQQGLARLLVLAGMSDARAPTLAAALNDYTDEDDLTRERGAERETYAAAGLAAPADGPLSSRWEALEAFGWRSARIENRAFWDWSAASSRETGLNINTAPKPVLEAVLGNARLAQAIIARRQASPIVDMEEAASLTASATRAEAAAIALAPAGVFRVRAVFGARALHGRERRLKFEGAEAQRPFTWMEERELSVAPLRDGETADDLSLDASAA